MLKHVFIQNPVAQQEAEVLSGFLLGEIITATLKRSATVTPCLAVHHELHKSHPLLLNRPPIQHDGQFEAVVCGPRLSASKLLICARQNGHLWQRMAVFSYSVNE